MSQWPSEESFTEQGAQHAPSKPRLWTRKWVQITGSSLAAFVLGAGIGGGEAQSTDPTNASAAQEADAAASQKLDEVKDELGDAEGALKRLQEQLTAQRANQTEAIAAVRAQARAAKQEAVRQARAKAKTQQARAVAAAVADVKAEAEAEAEAQRPVAASSGGGTDPRFNWCYEANDAGYGPYEQGVDPEYDWYDDRDGDGIVCET